MEALASFPARPVAAGHGLISAEPMQLRRHDIDSHFDAALAVDSPASGSDIRLIERPKSLEEPMSQEDGIGMQ